MRGAERGERDQRHVPDLPLALHLREPQQDRREPRGAALRRLLPVGRGHRLGHRGAVRGAAERPPRGLAERVGGGLCLMARIATRSRGLTLADLRGVRSRHRRERTMRGLFFAAALLSVVISVAIVASLAGGALDFLRKVELESLWSRGWFPRRNLFDVKTIFAGTMMVSVIAMVVAAPLGLGSAMYLSEYASPRSRRFLKPILETLASVPSVVMAFFALRFISPEVVQRFFGSEVPLFSITAAGLAVGLLVTPLVASIAEERH